MLQRMKYRVKLNTKDLATYGDPINFFELKYKNGVKSEKASLDDVIVEGNSSEWKIQEISISMISRLALGEAQITIWFRVPPTPTNKDTTQRSPSIGYVVIGTERDWVYLTGSQLDDRVAKIKQLPIYNFGIIAIIIGILISAIAFGITIPAPTHHLLIPVGYLIITFIASTLFILGGVAAMYGFPRYNFYWGDYIKVVTHKRTVGKYIINVVVIALILSIVGSIVGTLFFIK